MPIRLTSSDYKVIGLAVVVAAVSVALGLKYFTRAFPEAAIEFRVNRDDSAPIAEKFLAERGLRVEGHRHAAVFAFDDETKVYLERTQGLVRMNALTQGPIHLWLWSHRWFKPQQKEEFRVDVSPRGEPVGFAHEIPESAPGANLDPEAARAIAEKFLREVMKRELAGLEFVEMETEKRPARTDHSFTWKQRDVDLGEGSLRVEVEVDGDQVAAYHEFVKIPEQWSRDYQKLRSRNLSAQVVAEVFFVLLGVAMLVILVQRLRDREVPVRLSVGFGIVASVLYFLGQLNAFSLAEFGYRTTDSYSSFVTSYVRENLLAALGLGAFILLLVAAAEPTYRQNYPTLVSLRRYLSWQGLRSRSFFMANAVGIGLTFFFFAYQTLFYLGAEKLGAWAPADVPFTNLLNTRIPWVTVLFIGFFPAVSEEMQFRAFGIPFLNRLLRSKLVALVLAAFIWGFLHSAYPNQPFFIRGVEVGLGGVIVGFIMLRFGILAVLIWHYSVDALYTAFLLLRSPNHYLMVSGAITAGIMLIPFLVALIVYWRTGTFADEATLTNASVGVSRMPRREAAAEAGAPLAYQPLSQRRLVLAGVLALIFLALAFIPVHRFGEGTESRTSPQDAVRLADEFLKQRQVEVASYRRAAWLDDNVNRLALRYLQEHRSIEECERIYRQATKLVLWQVRYYRPLQKEEHLVFVDPEAGQVFAYRRVVDENAPGASLSPEEARALGEKFIQQQGYQLAGFDLQDSQAKRRKARQDYTLVWEAKPGDPRNVEEARFRLQVDVAGAEVVGFTRFFHLPEEWRRRQTATRLPNAILMGAASLLVLGVVAGALTLFVKQVRRGQIPWRASAKVGAALAVIMLLAGLNQLPMLYEQYNTSEPLAAFQLRLVIGLVLSALLGGLVGWLVVGLAGSLYPNAWRIFRSSARRVWRRDAAVALVVSLAALVAVGRLVGLLGSVFHAFAPVQVESLVGTLGAISPGGGSFLRGLLIGIIVPALAAVALYGVRLGFSRRAWWFGVGGLLFLVFVGPTRAHSVLEFLIGWAMALLGLVVAVAIVVVFFRDNILAYVVTAFALPIAMPLVKLLSQPATFYRWNDLLLAVLAAIVLGWMFAVWERSQGASEHASTAGGESVM